jgi:heptosyltransferase-2
MEYDEIEERILIVKLDAMGDVLRTTTVLPALKEKYPRSHVTWITRENACGLLSGNRSIDRVLVVERNYLEFLLTEDFDIVVGVDADPLSASITTLARGQKKFGFVSDGRGGVRPLSASAESWWRLGLDDVLKRTNRATYGEWLYAMCEMPAPVRRPQFTVQIDARSRVDEYLRTCVPPGNNVVLFNTGGSDRWREKRWKADHYSALATLLEQAYPAITVVLVGGPAETDLNRRLKMAHPAFVDGGTNNSLQSFGALVAACDWMLTPDSLGYHVACAVGTPALCVVGPTSPWELDLYESNFVLYAAMDCIGCYLSRCPFSSTCMDGLSPARILNFVRKWQDSGDNAPPAMVAEWEGFNVRSPVARPASNRESRATPNLLAARPLPLMSVSDSA